MRRPRCRLIAHWLERLAYWIYPEALYTITIITSEETKIFINCRKHVNEVMGHQEGYVVEADEIN